VQPDVIRPVERAPDQPSARTSTGGQDPPSGAHTSAREGPARPVDSPNDEGCHKHEQQLWHWNRSEHRGLNRCRLRTPRAPPAAERRRSKLARSCRYQTRWPKEADGFRNRLSKTGTCEYEPEGPTVPLQPRRLMIARPPTASNGCWAASSGHYTPQSIGSAGYWPWARSRNNSGNRRGAKSSCAAASSGKVHHRC